ncbi:uncharacterized protein LAESUDRAFT_330668 [Laetiporus sulphureus 93-53]|uniref:Uncharacterized protein n=1 Tax=Laetiporus sulphureus 93-53 TaxID=1314785 RepID=A0A165CXD2_9APHY|nr:uncharacterized protein LAESUDRAFT_330668 [Laetiporus sulphureus 93-53]KZT03662.1 hypothetical protein LAESUDRAFT_330668 [Laetiporus sulphureus 93-53]
MPLTISCMPEEILEHILQFAVVTSSPSAGYRPSWHSMKGYVPSGNSTRVPAHIAPLLVSRTWRRIATPLHYRHVVLRTARNTALLAGTLRTSPELGELVRSIRIEGTFDALVDVVCSCRNLEAFDMTVDNGSAPPVAPGMISSAQADPHEADAKVFKFCSSFAKMRKIRHLVIRKNAYLTQPGPTLIFEQLGKAITSWKHLETVNIAFRFSPSPASASFAASLAIAPKLRDVSALLPAVWNTTLLEISANPSLERIHLTPDTELMGAHLFLAEARKHSRLIELIRAGTPIMRMRARTTTAIPLPTQAIESPNKLRPGFSSQALPARSKPEHLTRRGALPMLVTPPVRNAPAGRRMSAV